jgi:hypothetical protein
MLENGLELLIDAIEVVLKIISGGLYKISVFFDAFGSDGGFATNQT